MGRLPTVCAAWLLAVVVAAPARADVTPSLLTGFNLTSWSQKDGIAASLIWSLAQDPVGYLWLGTESGLLRFDGVRFVPWEDLWAVPQPHASVRAVCAARDGALWFGTAEPGAIGVIAGDTVRMYGEADGLPPGMVTALVQAADDTLWAAGRFGVVRLVEGRWTPAGEGLPPGVVNDLVIAPDGAVLAGAATGVYRRPRHAAAFHPVGVSRDAVRSIALGPDGRMWRTDPIVGVRAVAAPDGAPDPAAPRARGARLLHDSRGDLWVGTGGQGLWRLRHDAAGAVSLFQRTSTVTGLSDDGATSMIEDREGNVWVATRDGLNRLTPYKVTPILDLGLVNAVDVTPDGNVWVGTADAIVSFASGRMEARSAAVGLPNPPLAAMHADRAGNLWVATARELIRTRGGRLDRVLPLERLGLSEVTDITSDGADGLWVHDSRSGLWRWTGHGVSPAAVPRELQSVPLLASYTDRDGRAWFAYDNGTVASIDRSGAMRVAGERDGLRGGPYRAIHQDRDGSVWFGGDGVLVRFADGGFSALPPLPSTPPGPIIGIADDDRGALWLAVEAAGLLRVSREELRAAIASPAHRIRFSAYDKGDGSAGTSRWFGNRAAVQAADGRLWFVAGRGVTIVDPAVLVHDGASEASVRIEGAVVDGRRLAPRAGSALPPRTARVQVEYTALNLTAPLKTRFRHRLEGFDDTWVDAGTTRSASYTNLPPRLYTFQVMATGPDGTFTGTPVAWRFEIRPAFYQTWAFATMSTLALGVAIGGAWRLHVRRMRHQFSLLLGERARLSREVHDTLLQSMFGFALQCDALAEEAAASAPALRSRLASLRQQVEADIREARQSIWNLRSPSLVEHDLPSALRAVGDQAAASGRLRVTVEVAGAVRRAAPEIEEQLLRIGREALSNSLRHAQATHVRVGLEYGTRHIRLTVSDDGRGFDVANVADANEHLGLTSMRERAEAVQGTLALESRPAAGTTVTATIPG